MTKKYAHFCQDGHQIIGFNDGEYERCPVCSLLDRLIETDRQWRALMAEAEQCRAEDVIGPGPHLQCTLPAGHEGAHVAHGGEGRELRRWFIPSRTSSGVPE